MILFAVHVRTVQCTHVDTGTRDPELQRMEYELTSDDSDHDDSGLIGKRKTLRAYSPQIRRRIVVGVAVGLVIIIIILGVGLGAGLGNSGSSRSTCEQVDKLERFNCFPGRNTNAAECSRRGCCWNDEVTDNSPRCYYAADYVQGYEVSSVEHSDLGPMLYLSWLKKSYFSADQFPYPGAVEKLAVKALFETNNRLHVKVSKFFTEIGGKAFVLTIFRRLHGIYKQTNLCIHDHA